MKVATSYHSRKCLLLAEETAVGRKQRWRSITRLSIRFLVASKKLLKLILIPAQCLPWHSHLGGGAHKVLVGMLKMQEKMQPAILPCHLHP